MASVKIDPELLARLYPMTPKEAAKSIADQIRREGFTLSDEATRAAVKQALIDSGRWIRFEEIMRLVRFQFGNVETHLVGNALAALLAENLILHRWNQAYWEYADPGVDLPAA